MPTATVVCLALLVTAALVLAASGPAASASSPEWGMLLMSVFGGLALFLFGLDQMSDGLKSAAGSKVKQILARFTSNRFKAAATGAAVTAIIQSSSVTTVLVVGFVSAGLMTLTQSVGVILGANVGTTITAQIVAFNVQKAALGIIAVGFLLLFASKRDRIVQVGRILMGLGLVFFGMGVMGDAMYPLRSYEPFIEFMGGMQNPLAGIAAGAAFTALVQSSSATTGVIVALASQGLLSLPAGISLIFGANIGTCVTAVLASIGKSPEARRVALVHVIFNVLGVILWVAFIPQLANMVEIVSPKAGHLEGTARLSTEVPRQIANAHAIFNISNTLLLLPFAAFLAWLATRLVSDVEEDPLIRAKFLDKEAIEVPALALHNARLETSHLGEIVCNMMQRLPEAYLAKETAALDAISKDDDIADNLEGEILRYLAVLRKADLTSKESLEFQAIMMATDALESVGDVISEDIVAIGRRRLASHLHASDTMKAIIASLYNDARSALENAVESVRTEDCAKAQAVLEQQDALDRKVREAYRHQESRFLGTDSDRLEVFRAEMKLVEKLRRVYSLTKRIARSVLLEENPTK